MRDYNIPWLLCLTARYALRSKRTPALLSRHMGRLCYCIGDLYKRLEKSDRAHSIDFILLRIIGLTPANDVIGTTNASSTAWIALLRYDKDLDID